MPDQHAYVCGALLFFAPLFRPADPYVFNFCASGTVVVALVVPFFVLLSCILKSNKSNGQVDVSYHRYVKRKKRRQPTHCLVLFSHLNVSRFLLLFVFVVALLCTLSSAFVVPSPTRSYASLSAAQLADEVDTVGNNVAVKSLLTKVQQERLLSKVAASGLLSKAQAAGISLSKVEPLLALAAEYPDILILVEASGPDLLKILPTVVDLAPGALPLLATAIATPPAVIQGAGIGALVAAAAAVALIPDDSVTNVALQTLAVGVAVPLAGASLAGAAILSKLTK